jgi:hypothetical protein
MRTFLGPSLISNPIRTGIGFFTAKSLKLSRFTSSFYFTQTSFINAHVTQSKFSHFMNSVIKVASDDIRNKTFTNGYKYADATSVYISGCVFKYCNDPTAGGAIYIGFPLPYYPNITFSTNLFKNCSAQLGGAISAGGIYPMLSKNCFCCCEAFERSHTFMIYSMKGAVYSNLTTINNCPGSKSSIQNIATLMRRSALFTAVNMTKNEINSEGLFFNSVNSGTVMIRFGMYVRCIGNSGFVFRNSSNLILTYVFVFNNTISKPFLTMNCDRMVNVAISRSFFHSNIYTEVLHAAKNKESTMLYISIQNSNIDNVSYAVMSNFSNRITNTGDTVRYFINTNYFFTEGCGITQATTVTYNKNVVSKKTLIVIFGSLSITTIIASFGVIYFFVSKRRDEETWLLRQQEQFYNAADYDV